MSASSGRWAPAAVVFDCDGTLVDSATANYQAWRDALRPAGVALDQAWYLDRTGLSATQLLDHLEAEHRRWLDRRVVHAEQRRRYLDNLHLLAEIKAVADLARRLHGCLPLAVASGGPRSSVEGALRHTGLLRLFDVVATSDDVTRPKPAPDLYLLATARLDVDPYHALALDDTAEGLTAARRAGLRTVDVRNRHALTAASQLLQQRP